MLDYNLTEEQNEFVFQNVILPSFSSNKQKSDKPVFILLVGQPGAGKTSLSKKASEDLSQEPIRFGADDLRAIHPNKMEIISKHEEEYPFLTKKDSGIWREKLVDYAISKRHNILIETILANENDWKLGTVEKARKAGYRTECFVLGVHEYLSTLGMYYRYETQKEELGYGFQPTFDIHNKAYDLLPDIAVNMLKHNTMDRVTVFNRDLKCFYDSDEHFKNKEMLREAIKQSRNSSLNQKEFTDAGKSWDDIKLLMNKRNASVEEKTHINKLVSEFNSLRYNFDYLRSSLFIKRMQRIS